MTGGTELAIALAFGALLVGLLASLALGLRSQRAAVRTARRALDVRDEAARRSEQATGALTSERDLFLAVFSALEEAVVLVDEQKRVTLANAAFRRLAQSGGDPVGRAVSESLRSPALADLLDAARASDGAIERDLALLPERRVVRARAERLAGRGVLAVAHDVTELRRLEQVRRDFVANVSHELRTPIAALAGYAETLLDGALDRPDQARSFVEVIQRNAERLGKLVDELLDLARAEAEPALPAEPVSTSAAIEEVRALLAPIAATRKVAVTAHVAPGEDRLLGRREPLERVLRNLIENAIRHSPEGGIVAVSASRAEGFVVIAVEDHGPGIEASHLPRIFERFYRADAGRARERGGAGLGLAIVKHLVEAMGGEVACESAPRQGARFVVRLPAAPG